MENPIIIALDFPGRPEVEAFLANFSNESLHVKVGMELYYSEGPSIISYLKDQGHQIFLDLKLHDIPNTVKSAMKRLAQLNVDLVNVHALGGVKMMEAALEGLDAGTPLGQMRPKCIAVTQLTSSSLEMVQNEQKINGTLEDSVEHLARLANKSGMDGVVCSTWEARMITDACGESFLKVTPGIRLKGDDANDQVRVATPGVAKQNTSSAIVVGRSITGANDPLAAYKNVRNEWESGQ